MLLGTELKHTTVPRFLLLLVTIVATLHLCRGSLAEQTQEHIIYPFPFEELKTFPLPPGDNAWLVDIITGGGLTGAGMGRIAVTSQGNVSASRPDGPLFLSISCLNKISIEDVNKLSLLVFSADPAKWKKNYGGVTPDAMGYQILLHLREPNGSEHVYSSEWASGSWETLPKDLVDLEQVVWKVGTEFLGNCRK